MTSAADWCRELHGVDNECFIVGLGDGLHVAEMVQQKRPTKVYVVDCRPECALNFKKNYPALAGIVELIIVENEMVLLRHPIMSEVLEKNLSSFAYTPVWPSGDERFRNFHRHLTGRSKESLELFFKKHGLTKDIQIKEETGERYLNIKDLEILIQEEVPTFLRLNCFRILKELIL